MAEQTHRSSSASDRTPASVMKAMAQNEAAYPKDDCRECGAVIRIGFFFDGFGRNRDLDRAHPTFYSNVSRLWEVHRDQKDPGRPAHQYWFRFYYSGLGTDLNEDANNDDAVYAATVAGSKLAGEALKGVKNTVKGVTRVDEVPEHDLVKRSKSAVQKAIKEGSTQPLVKAYKDVVKDVKTLPDKVVRIWNVWDPERLTNRVKATLRGAWSNFKKNPFKVAWTAGKEAAKATLIEGTPVIRDNETVAYLMGTGVDVRVDAALRQMKAAYEAVNAESHVVRIEISVFGADRGGVIAKQFVNDVVKKYKGRSEVDLRILGDHDKKRPNTELRIRFVGLLDSVASIMDESTFLGFLPFTDLLKQTHKDRTLTIPAAVERCVHFAAAHELRRNQRMDSLEKTRGEQYLFPGSSGDVTGVSPPGALGSRGELSRVALREMLNAALSSGAAMYSIEGMRSPRPTSYEKFAMAEPIEADGETFSVPELMEAYREIVPNKVGADLMPHMEVFIRWLAVRYQDPVFKDELADPAEQWLKDRDYFTPEQEHTKEMRELLGMKDNDPAKPAKVARVEELRKLAEERRARAMASRGESPPKQFRSLWKRLEEEIKTLEKSEKFEADLEKHRKWMEENRPEAVRRIRQDQEEMQASWDLRNAGIPEEDRPPPPQDPFSEMLAERKLQHKLLNVWREAATGANPLPPKVMTLFDWLVHDAMLSSWPDHLLASTTLYFRLRDKDIFGKTDFKKEMQQRGQDMQDAQRVDDLMKRQEQLTQPRPMASAP